MATSYVVPTFIVIVVLVFTADFDRIGLLICFYFQIPVTLRTDDSCVIS